MPTGLFPFLFNAVRPRLNDPNSSKFWLPGKLVEANGPNPSGKFLPIHTDAWDLGAIDDQEGATFRSTIAGSWWQVVSREHSLAGQVGIYDPTDPWPRIRLSDVTVEGIQNLLVTGELKLTETANGYSVPLVLQFGSYDEAHPPKLPQITIRGRFHVDQRYCSANKGSKECNGNYCEEIRGEGTFRFEITKALADATLEVRVEGSGAGRRISVAVTSLRIRGAGTDGLPLLSVKSLDIDTDYLGFRQTWINLATKAITSPATRKSLFLNLQNSLSRPANIARLSELLTDQLSGALDSILGSPQDLQALGESYSNPVDRLLFDRIGVAMNNPASRFYLPSSIYNVGNPVLEPYQAPTISLGPQSIGRTKLTDIRFDNVRAVGASNVMAVLDRFRLSGNEITLDLLFGTLNPPPRIRVERGGSQEFKVPAGPLQLTGNLTILFGSGATVPGTVAIDISAPVLSVTFQLTGDEPGNLKVDFKRAEVLVSDLSRISVKLQFDSGFLDIVNAIANENGSKQNICLQLNGAISGQLGQLSQSATEHLRKAVTEAL